MISRSYRNVGLIQFLLASLPVFSQLYTFNKRENDQRITCKLILSSIKSIRE
jgi:hypothetical protein